MPNHVYNTVTITGDKDDLLRLKRLLSMPQPIQLSKGEFDKLIFNFHSLITPDQSIWDEYYGPEPKGRSLEESLKFASNHWYDWNIRNWGTKWNAYDASISDNLSDESVKSYYIKYEFSTAWSEPAGIIEALAKKIHELKLNVFFSWTYEEEQGWGGVMESTPDGTIYVLGSWDIPDSHAEMLSRKGECYCEDYQPIFDDCPKDEAIKVLETQQELVENK